MYGFCKVYEMLYIFINGFFKEYENCTFSCMGFTRNTRAIHFHKWVLQKIWELQLIFLNWMMGCCQCQKCAKIVQIKLTNLFVCLIPFLWTEIQVPLYVATKMAKIRKASLAVPSPDTYATAGLKWVGYEPRCTPYWVHSIMWWLIQMIPEPIMDSVRLRSCLNIRKRGQAKEARSKAEWSVLWLAVLHHLWTHNHGLQPSSSGSTVFQLTHWKIWTFEHHEPTLNFLDNWWRSFHPVGCSQIVWFVCGLMKCRNM